MFASVALVSLCSICYRLNFNLATVALLLMIVVVLASRLGSFFTSISRKYEDSVLLSDAEPAEDQVQDVIVAGGTGDLIQCS